MGRSSQMDWFVVHGYCKSNRTEQSSKEESYYFFLIALQLSTFNISISDVRICEKFDFGRISNCTVYPNVYKSLCTESESCCFFVCLLSPVNNITPKKNKLSKPNFPKTDQTMNCNCKTEFSGLIVCLYKMWFATASHRWIRCYGIEVFGKFPLLYASIHFVTTKNKTESRCGRLWWSLRHTTFTTIKKGYKIADR